MSDSNTHTQPPQMSNGTATAVYILYLVSLITAITAVIGVVMAYINKGCGNYLDSHYQFQIRTFWIGILYGLIGLITIPILIGWLLLLFTLIWFIIRCVKGLKFIGEFKPMPDPNSWLFG